MGKVIQMVIVSDISTLFICGFNEETEVMTFRTSHEPKYLQNEKVLMDGELVYTNLFHFPSMFLDKFVTENMD